MKLKSLQNSFRLRLFTRPLRLMVLMLALLLPSIAQAGESISPEGTITVSTPITSISELIKTIESQTDYLVVFSNNDMDVNKSIRVASGTYTVRQVLEQALKNEKIGIVFDNNYIILKKASDSPALSAQRSVVKGTVHDESKQPLIGVSVSVKGTNIGVATNVDGSFSIQAAPRDVLMFNYLGYQPIELRVGTSTFLSVILQEDALMMDDVVVTGYGEFRKSSYTGAVSVVNMDKLKDIPALSATQMLEAQVPGLSIGSSSHQPGAYKSMKIRGTGSMNAGNQPLIVLDGVPIVATNYSLDGDNSTGLDALSSINPNDIESITVLKDATSTALYGARGSNGVIHITTKKGKDGPTRFAFKAYTSVSDFAMKFRETMGGQERRDLLYEGYVNEYLEKKYTYEQAIAYADGKIDSTAAIPENGNWSDWKDAMTRTGVQQGYDLSVTGGNANTNFAASIGYVDEKGVLLSSMFKRYSGRLAVNHKYKNFDFGVNTMFSVTENDAARENYYYTSPMYAWIYSLTPSVPIYNEDGSYNTNFSVNNGFNPLYEEEVNDRYTKVYRFLGNINVGWQIFDFLKLSSTLGVEQSTTREFKYFSPLSMDGKTNDGSSVMRSPSIMRYTSSTRLAYQQDFGKHSLNGSAVFELFSHDYENLSASAKSYGQLHRPAVSNASAPTGAVHYLEEDRMVSFLAFANYSYDDKYYLSATFRNDASSRLAKRRANFWSLSGSWRITQEPFMEPFNNWLSDLKVKASYGVNGTLPGGWYSYMPLYVASSTYGSLNAISESSIGNPDLSWEKGYNANIGLDVTLFNRVSMEFNFYQRDTKDLLMNDPIAAHIGFMSQTRNVGHLRNRGFEMEINSVNIQKDKFRWTSALNLGTNRTKVVSTNTKGEDMFVDWYILQKGQPYFTLYIIEAKGVNPENGKMQYYYNHSGSDYGPRDLTEDVTKASRTPFKNIEPKLTGGLTNTFTYGQLDLSFTLSYSLGGYSLDKEMWAGQDDGFRDYTNKSTELRRRWQKPGDITDVPRYVNGYNHGGYYTTSRAIHSTNHLRLKNLSLGARLPKKWAETIRMNSARVYFVGNNLLTWSKDKLYDPELTGMVGINAPPLKTFSFGIELGF